MDTPITVAIITASASIIVASASFFFAKRYVVKAKWQQEKLSHYKILLSSISDLATEGTDVKAANLGYFQAFNTIALVAPQNVIDALIAFQEEIRSTNSNKNLINHDKLLKELLLAIRADISLASKDDKETFKFHLIGTFPK